MRLTSFSLSHEGSADLQLMLDLDSKVQWYFKGNNVNLFMVSVSRHTISWCFEAFSSFYSALC
jgi:hypothetical protein